MSKEKRSVPKLRFPGFTEDWEQRKFLDLLDAQNGIRRGPFGSSLKKDSFVKKSDYVVYEQQNAIYDNYETRYFISKEKYNELIRFNIQPGDFIMSGAGTIGRISMVPDGIKKGVFNQALIRFKVNKDSINPLYFLKFMQSDMMQKQLTQANPGSAMTNLVPMDELKKWDVIIPSLEEQNRISTFINQMDAFITLHQRKLEHLNLKKKALLQKLFPKNGECYPELRFPGFTDAWEQRELSSLTEYIGTGKSRFVIKVFGEYAILGSTNVIGYDDAYDYDGNFILTARVGANAGQLYQYSGKVKITDNTVFLMSDRSQFIYYALTHFDLRRLSFGTGQPLVKSSELQKLKLCVPVSKSEQEKIGEIFNNIDNIITLHQRKLDHLQLQKKALLQQMFV